jgi:serine/threonine protein kinase
MAETQDRRRGVLVSVDVNKTQAEQQSKPVKPPLNVVVSSRRTKDKKALFQDVCATRVGELIELIDGEDDSLIQWSFDDFEYVRILGKGGAASVVCAKENQSGYEVALKIQPAGEDAICELDIHEPLDHANIVSIMDYFFTDETFGPNQAEDDCREPDCSSSSCCCSTQSSSRSLVMILEVCAGGSLFDVIRDCPNGFMEAQQAASYFWNAVNAMHYVHNQDIIHCDLKSMNFLVHGKTLKICDFGMSVRKDEREIIGGSPVYMSPEHLMAWRHMSADFDHRADIYSLGVILFEMLVGYLPYEVLSNHAHDDSLLAHFDNLGLDDDEDDLFRMPVLDLRKLDDCTDNEPFYMPPPIFPDSVSTEAQDLILSLMEPSRKERISLSEVKRHPWILRYISQG